VVGNDPVAWNGEKCFNTRSASGASLPESANGGQIDQRVLYRLLIYVK